MKQKGELIKIHFQEKTIFQSKLFFELETKLTEGFV